MKYRLLAGAVLLGLAGLSSCRQEEPLGPSGKTDDPMTTLAFVSDPMSFHRVTTRASDIKDEDEKRINNLHIFFFDADGNYLEGGYLTGYPDAAQKGGYYAPGEGVTLLKIDRELFDKVYNDDSQEREFSHKIYGYDINRHANEIATRNVKAAGLSRDIVLQVRPFEEFEQPTEKAIMVTNPPYGERITTDDLLGLYRTIGERLKHAFSGNEAWILSYRDECFDQIGLKASEKIPLFNGALACQFRKYQLFSGRFKDYMETNADDFRASRGDHPGEFRPRRDLRSPRRPDDSRRERPDGGRRSRPGNDRPPRYGENRRERPDGGPRGRYGDNRGRRPYDTRDSRKPFDQENKTNRYENQD